MRSINPATGEVLKNYPDHTDAEVAASLVRAVETFESWREVPFAERSLLMHRAAAELRDRRDEHAALMTAEMGKTCASARAEAEKCALCCDFYAEHAEAFLAPEEVATDASRSLVRYDPIGPVLAVMPWNFPYWQVFRFAAPALMAGNVGLLKHASNVPGCALAIGEAFRRAGFPEGCFQTLMIGSRAVDAVIRNEAVRAVTLTGSEPAGVAVASAAGSCLKKTVLELGGSDPFLILADADIPKAAKAAAQARCINNGQSCIAAKRFIVVEEVAEAFEEAFVAAMAALKVGDPMDPSTDVGPMAREDLLAELHDQVERSVRAGAILRLGGKRLEGPGAFYPPTVLTGVRPGMPAFDEETFGPVAAVIRAVDEEDAVALANRSAFGLGASLWTNDLARGEALARRIESGAVFVNGPVKSDPRLPFGGVKRSGYGRELGAFGIREFVNIKTVWIA
jgi:succinate-semialdehyde dehydrogenase / glutarate-semialdehyde dehydrogenase